MTSEEFLTALCRRGRNAGPWLLQDAALHEELDSGQVAAVIGEVWSMAEYPESHLRRVDWLWLFDMAGYTVDGIPAERPTQPVTLWRGATPSHCRRMAWTANQALAGWFAGRFGTGVHVYQATVPPSALLCYIGDSGREEAEYVINPAKPLTIGRVS